MRNLIFSLVLAYASQLAMAQDTFRNPVINGDVADPTVIHYGESYYAAGTSSEWAPYYPLFRSQDLVNWEQIGHIFDEKPEWTMSSFWAPELFAHNDKVYCYYTARRKSDRISYIGVAVADRPEGPYVDHGELITAGSEDIDAYVYDDHGQLYITWKAYGLDPRPIEILGSRLSSDGLHLEGEPFTLLVDEEQIGIEGQCIFREGDWYYMLYSARGCCGGDSDYEVRVARSRSMTAPFINYSDNPILMRSEDFLSCGHGTLVNTPDGRRFYLCHAYQRGGDFFKGRQPILQQLAMGSDEWPHFLTGRLATVRQPMPFAGTKQQSWQGFIDEFTTTELHHSWTWNYPYSDVCIGTPGNGKLMLSGTPKAEGAAAALCQRTPARDYTFAVSVQNDGQSQRGITLYGDAGNYVALVLRHRSLQLITLRKGEEKVLEEIPMKAKTVRLQGQVTDGTRVTFSYDAGQGMQTLSDKPLDIHNILPWDRVTRPGMLSGVVDGGKEKAATFTHFEIR